MEKKSLKFCSPYIYLSLKSPYISFKILLDSLNPHAHCDKYPEDTKELFVEPIWMKTLQQNRSSEKPFPFTLYAVPLTGSNQAGGGNDP